MHKCSVCEEPAPYMMKGTTTYYCQDCAEEFFGDISYLVKASLAKAQDQADTIKDIVDGEPKTDE